MTEHIFSPATNKQTNNGEKKRKNKSISCVGLQEGDVQQKMMNDRAILGFESLQNFWAFIFSFYGYANLAAFLTYLQVHW